MRVVFFGTPDFAIPSLDMLLASSHELLAVVTQPDRIIGKRVTVPCVKQWAINNGVPVLQYASVSREGIQDIRSLNADIIVTCSFGQILSDELLQVVPFGVINVHGSLLPKYRGASPIQQCILEGERETGITIMQTVSAVDAGDIIYQERILISSDDTAGSLFDKLSVLGASALGTALNMIENGTASYTPQEQLEATFCKMIKKESGILNFCRTCAELDRFVRAMTPWPTAYTFLGGKLLKVFRVENTCLECDADTSCGTVVFADRQHGLCVKVQDGVCELVDVQLADSKRMNAREMLLGHKVQVGEKLGE